MHSQEKTLLKAVLEPLLEDFQYWFSRSLSLLESQPLTFLSPDQQTQLLQRVQKAHQEVTTVQMLFNATEGQVGIDPKTLIPWHQLVTECWVLARQYRMANQKNVPIQEDFYKGDPVE
jgi:hypothetical protein